VLFGRARINAAAIDSATREPVESSLAPEKNREHRRHLFRIETDNTFVPISLALNVVRDSTVTQKLNICV
jgi:hypothetical protein